MTKMIDLEKISAECRAERMAERAIRRAAPPTKKKTDALRKRPNRDSNATMADAQSAALEDEATRLLAAEGFDAIGQPKTDDDDVAEHWSNDPLLPAYVDIYGDLFSALDMLAKNRAALRQESQSGAYTMTADGVSRRTIAALGTTHLTPDEAGMPTQATGNLSSASYAVAIEERITRRDRWARSEAPYGACLDAWGEVVYGTRRLRATQAQPPMTHILFDAIRGPYWYARYSPVEPGGWRGQRTYSTRETARKAGKVSGENRRKYASNAERQRAYRARKRQEKAAPVLVTDVKNLAPIDWQADA